MTTYRPVWAEVDLDAVRANVRTLAGVASPAALLAVVKADGYGHGAVPVARAALDAGAQWLGVALVEEGVRAARRRHRRARPRAVGAAASGRPRRRRVRSHARGYTRAGIDALAKAVADVGRGAAAGAPEGRHRDAPRRLRARDARRARRVDRRARRAPPRRRPHPPRRRRRARQPVHAGAARPVRHCARRPPTRRPYASTSSTRPTRRRCSRSRTAPASTSCAAGSPCTGCRPRPVSPAGCRCARRWR